MNTITADRILCCAPAPSPDFCFAAVRNPILHDGACHHGLRVDVHRLGLDALHRDSLSSLGYKYLHLAAHLLDLVAGAEEEVALSHRHVGHYPDRLVPSN